MSFLKSCRVMTSLAMLLVTISVSGCERYKAAAPSSDPVRVADLDPRDEAPCADPGVDGTFREVAVKSRAAWASCAEKHNNVVSQFNKTRDSLRGKVE